MNRNRVRSAAAGSLLLLGPLAFAGTASAFDTAPHFDITADVLRSEGFLPPAVTTVQSANFLVDFYEFIGNPSLQYALDPACRLKATKVLAIGDAQHFDDLYTPTEVAHKWDAMLGATKSTAEALTRKHDVLGLLVLLGMSLHNVQDFYAHSNWVEGMYGGTMGPPLGAGRLAKYGSHPTWLAMDRRDREALYVYTKLRMGRVVTRTHGEWDSDSTALNKDWEGRPRHTDAYICAWFASRQWVRIFREFVNDRAVWNDMQLRSQAWGDAHRDWYYAQKISFYGGHWNGNGGATALTKAFGKRAAATSPDLLVGAVTNYLGGTCIGGNRSRLRAKAESLLVTWGDAPYTTPIDVPLTSAEPESVRFVYLRVHSVDLTDGGDGPLGGEMDWYSTALIDGQEYMSGLIDEHDHFDFDKSPYAPWTMTKVVPVKTQFVHYMFTLMELDYSSDDLIDINPATGRSTLVFDYSPWSDQASGDLKGSRLLVADGKGDCDCAKATFGLSSRIATSFSR